MSAQLLGQVLVFAPQPFEVPAQCIAFALGPVGALDLLAAIDGSLRNGWVWRKADPPPDR